MFLTQSLAHVCWINFDLCNRTELAAYLPHLRKCLPQTSGSPPPPPTGEKKASLPTTVKEPNLGRQQLSVPNNELTQAEFLLSTNWCLDMTASLSSCGNPSRMTAGVWDCLKRSQWVPPWWGGAPPSWGASAQALMKPLYIESNSVIKDLPRVCHSSDSMLQARNRKMNKRWDYILILCLMSWTNNQVPIILLEITLLKKNRLWSQSWKLSEHTHECSLKINHCHLVSVLNFRYQTMPFFNLKSLTNLLVKISKFFPLLYEFKDSCS